MTEPSVSEQDPIVNQSYALHFVVAMVVLMATLFWALWDESWGQRPWKTYQKEWKERYVTFLQRAQAGAVQSEREIKQSTEYRRLEQELQSAEAQAREQQNVLQTKISRLNAEIQAVQRVLTERRAYVNALTYEIESRGVESAPQQQELEQYKRRKSTVRYPDGHAKQYDFDGLEARYKELNDARAQASAELGELLKPVTEAKAKLSQYITDQLPGLTPAQIEGLRRKTEEFDPTIIQVHVADANIVDRCESCHLGVRAPLTITVETVTQGKRPDAYARAFVSHPGPDLLKVHPPEKFGCSSCHQGNGRATTSVEKAHGNDANWPWPLFPKENAEAGCQSCHAADMLFAGGDAGRTINEGKDLFRQRGCTGCHRYQGYDKEAEELTAISQQMGQLEANKRDNLKQSASLMKQADATASNEEANKLNEQALALKVANSQADATIQQLDLQARSLMQERTKAGPNLKDIRLKLKKDWVPLWLKRPSAFRPATKMPDFRLTEHQVQAMSAYLWQSALTDTLPKQERGNATRGKELLETRGCLACHSIGEGVQAKGGTFAANLARLGEKANYDYLVRWVHNPRKRTRPYCSYEKKDIGPEDYGRKGLPYVFDTEHSQCPNDGHELQVQNMTVMPSLRLTMDDARDIAAYLVGTDNHGQTYANAAFMDDPSLKEEGRKWVRHFGCAGCHEIAGLEDEGRVGTDLTAEGSKPVEQLDFARLTETAQRGGKEPITDPDHLQSLPDGPAKGAWYSQKGFFEHKLAEPEIYDRGKIKRESEALRMPDMHLDKTQVGALTTFLMGSQASSLPESYQYRPKDTRRDIQEGWWVVKKYNCMGCHQFLVGQKTALMGLQQYQENPEQLPPQLLTEGARVDPEWLRRFLSNPALSSTDTDRNGVRPYLKLRMPTYFFSDNELRKLVRFFQALSQQPLPYVPQPVPVLSNEETIVARDLFSSSSAPCLKCHATGDVRHDRSATAPNFLLAKDRLKPDWVARWIVDPQAISPGTSMPSGLFRRDGDRWVFAGAAPAALQAEHKDHTKLLVDYIFQLTPAEQRRAASAQGH